MFLGDNFQDFFFSPVPGIPALCLGRRWVITSRKFGRFGVQASSASCSTCSPLLPDCDCVRRIYASDYYIFIIDGGRHLEFAA